MDSRYFIGIDTYSDNKSKGALVTMKQHADGTMEVVKVMKWYDKYEWLQKLKVKFYMWRMTNKFARYYKKVKVYKETEYGKEWEEKRKKRYNKKYL